MNITPPTEIEKEFTNKIRRQALIDSNKELLSYQASTNLNQIKWWYNQAIENNIERMKLYN